MTAIENLQRWLKKLRATLARTERWSAPWMKAWIIEAHLEGELARLKAGLTSCGCDLCREGLATIQANPGVTKVRGDTGRPGRPPVALPMDRLRELYQQGHGYRAIAEVMAQEYGVEASHMTIKRRLCGS